MRLDNKRKRLFFLLLSLLIFGIFQYSIHKIFGMVYYPDEFGYWANAARLAGYDWSNLTALGSYYSFGYSLLLVPIMKTYSDGVTAYRTAIAVNMLLQAAAIPLLYRIFQKIFPKSDGQAVISAVGIALFYPPWIFYGQTTLAEGFLFFLYIGIVCLMVRNMERMRPGTLGLLLFALIYICFVHMRTVGIAAAAFLVLLCWLGKEPKHRKRMFVVIGVLIAGGTLGVLLRLLVIQFVYGNTDQSMLAHNDITGQLERVLAICSVEGMTRFLCGCVGKLFYLGAASFGTVYYALYYIGKNSIYLIQNIHQKKPISVQEWISLFLLLSFAGQFLVTAVYLHNPRRVDEVVYGRYNDYLLPVFMGIGFLLMYRCRHYGRRVSCVIALQSAMLPVVLYGEKLYGGNEMQGYFMAGIGYLVDDLHFDVISDMAGICLLSNFMILAVSVGVWIARKARMPVPVMAVIALTEIIMGIGLHYKYTYRFNDLINMELQISNYIEHGEEDVPVTYMYEGRIAYIDTVQFNLPAREIQVISEEELGPALEKYTKEDNREGKKELLGLEGYLILDIDSIHREQAEQIWDPCVESAYFVLYDLKK